MKKLVLFCSAIFVSAAFASAEVDWLTDFDAAKAKAKSDHKLVLLEFTGSDWCGYCKLMQAEVFSKPQFQEYAAKNLILVELDFPRAKPQSDAVKKQNMKLASEYEIEGFPTLIVLNPKGSEWPISSATSKADRTPSLPRWKSCARASGRTPARFSTS